MNAPIDWSSAVAILAGGVILGLLFVYFFSRRKAAATIGGDADVELKDLEAKRDVLIQRLRDLDADASEEERLRIEHETAAVLRMIDQRPTREAAPVAPVRASTMTPALTGVLWGTGAFCLLAVLAYFVMREATPREQQPNPMQAAPQQQQPPAQTSPMVTQLEQAVQREPDNLELRNNLAQAYLEVENLMGVFKETQVVLAKRPDDSRALTLQGLVRLAMGESATAIDMLQRATKSDRTNLDAWVGLAWVSIQSGKVKDAEAAIAEAIKVSPENKARLDDVLTQMKAQHAMAQQQPSSGGELPAGHPPTDSPAPAPAPATADGKPGIRITIEIDPSARSRANANGVLFVIARMSPAAPPVAVRRIDASSLPTTIDLSSADSMMGQPLPDRVRIEARLDSDRDPLTKPATDPAASMDGVALGSAIKLALK